MCEDDRLRRFGRPAALVVAALLLALPAGAEAPEPARTTDAGEASEKDRIRPDYRRGEVTRREAAAPEAPPVPEELRMAPAPQRSVQRTPPPARDDGRESGVTRRNGNHRRPPADGVNALEAEAFAAGAWAAEEMARTRGRRQYYRVGFREGLRRALDDPSLGRWDYHDGLRMGRLDPQARAAGANEAAAAADEAAFPAAERRVADQFSDLSREPQFRPQPVPPPWVAPATMTFALAPTREEIFADLPPEGVLGQRFVRAFHDRGLDTWGIYRARAYRDVFEPRWADPEPAFDLWLEGRRRSRFYRGLDRDGRRLFRALFAEAFRDELPGFFNPYLLRGHRQGFVDGWDYGALVSYEWSYRLGYTEGFDEGAREAATLAFPSAYFGAYQRSYEAAFDDWSATARPSILDLRVLDGDDDGVFEPGEPVWIDFELANFGGADGAFAVRAAGRELAEPVETSLELKARDVNTPDEPLRAVVREDAPLGRRASLILTVGDERREVAVLVSRPLAIPGGVTVLGEDVIGGRARIEVRVANLSRRAVEGAVARSRIVRGAEPRRVTGAAAEDQRAVAAWPGEALELGVVEPGGEVAAVFELTALRPTALLGGEVEIDVEVVARGAIQDTASLRTTDLASDLDRPELIDYMLSLARTDEASRTEIETVRALLARRLEADWRAAVRGRGNPYREDLKEDGERTALGELVQVVRRERRSFASPAVFEGLGAEIRRQADDLPGAHPLLRKAMKKLARRLS